MKKFHFPVLLTGAAILVLFMAGCKKSSGSNNNDGRSSLVNGLVASFTNSAITNGQSATPVTYSFTYDSLNRMLEEVSSDGESPITLTYGTGTVTEVQGTVTTIFTLGNDGYAASDNQGNTYTYSDGLLLSMINTSGASTINTVVNGNIVNSVETAVGGATTTLGFTYTNMPNYISTNIDRYTGNIDANLPASESINGVSATFTWNNIDSKGRPQSLKIVEGNSTLTRTYTYLYP
jgi:hypothetical protein